MVGNHTVASDGDLLLGVYCPVNQIPVIVMEMMLYSLRKFVGLYNNIPSSITLSILDDVCLGLRYLHTRTPPIIHQNLNPHNILLNHSLQAKITGLDINRVIKSDRMVQAPGRLDFMPPEHFLQEPSYSPSTDVFCYGEVILFATTCMWPIPSPHLTADPETYLLKPVTEVERRRQYLDKMTEDATGLKQLVIACLQNLPEKRPSIEEVSVTINQLKDACNKCHKLNSIVWWAKMLSQKEGENQLQQQVG